MRAALFQRRIEGPEPLPLPGERRRELRLRLGDVGDLRPFADRLRRLAARRARYTSSSFPKFESYQAALSNL